MFNPNKQAVKPKKPKVPSYKDIVPKEWQKKETKNCHYVFVQGDLTIRRHISDVCFARFSSTSGIIKGKFLINQHNTASTYTNNAKYINDEKFRAKLLVRINWIVKESPFRWAFTNGKTAFLSHGLNFNCKVSHKYVFGACNAIREGWEFPWRVEYWHQLIDQGVSKELSYYVVSMMGISGMLLGGQGHAVIQQCPSGKAFDWFRKLTLANVVAIDKPMSELAISTYGVSSLFCCGKPSATHKDLFNGKNLKAFLKEFGAKGGQNEWGDAMTTISFTNPDLIKALKEIDNA